jgi:HEXXH motif-containing protein
MTLFLPRDVTLPDVGSRTARDVLSRALERALADVRALPRRARQLGGSASLLAACDAIAARLPDDGFRGALVSVLRRPNVGALLRCVRDDPQLERAGIVASSLLPELLATLLFELAYAGVLDVPIALEALPHRIVSLLAHAVIDCPEGVSGRFASSRVTVGHAVVDPSSVHPDASAFHAIDRALVLASVDNNPLAVFGAQPGDPPNAVDLAGREPPAWCRALRDALSLIESQLPAVRDEIDLHVHQFVPIGYHDETHRSASYPQALGTIYLTLHPSLMTMTEAVMHEFSHNKLHALLEVDPLLRNAPTASFRSPVRTDPRPLRGLLLALHAFIPIARLYERMVETDHPLAVRPSFRERFAQIRAINRESASVLFAHARPTSVGQAVMDELERWVRHFGGE